MAQIPFDTLAYSKALIDAGMQKKLAEAQAELQARVLRDLTKDKLATKDDIRQLAQATKNDTLRLEQSIKTLKQEMTVRMGSITCTGLIVLVALMKLLHL